MANAINFEGLIKEVGRCCLTEDVCDSCSKEQCLIGYCKKSLSTAIKQHSEFIDGGFDAIPYADTKVYDDVVLVDVLGFLLNQCKNCNLYHDEECVINIIRGALEVILLGESQDYKGSSFMYLSDIKRINPEIAEQVYAAFQKWKGGN